MATFSQNHKTKHFKSCNVDLAANQVSVHFDSFHEKIIFHWITCALLRESLRHLPGSKSIDYRVVLLLTTVVKQRKVASESAGSRPYLDARVRSSPDYVFPLLFVLNWRITFTAVHECEEKVLSRKIGFNVLTQVTLICMRFPTKTRCWC